MIERWRDIPGYEGEYQASDKGRIRSVPRRVRLVAHGTETTRSVPPRILNPGKIDKFGHVSVALGKGNSQCVHTLVALTFIGARPSRRDVRHKDGDASNNTLRNLCYSTRTRNNLDFAQHDRTKICADTVVAAKDTSRSVQSIVDAFGVRRSWVYRVRRAEIRVAR